MSEVKHTAFSPRVWGCSDVVLVDDERLHILPTRVGMFRGSRPVGWSSVYSPHACGDVPFDEMFPDRMVAFSPRVWGCSATPSHCATNASILPTRVGMFRPLLIRPLLIRHSPHACGDVPYSVYVHGRWIAFSPRVWGCSGRVQAHQRPQEILPTRVGMFRP